jgi:hypothetical protein
MLLRCVMQHAATLRFVFRWQNEFITNATSSFYLLTTTAPSVSEQRQRFVRLRRRRTPRFKIANHGPVNTTSQKFRRMHGDPSVEHLWNVGQFLPDYTAQHPRRKASSYSPSWESEISPEMYLLYKTFREFWWMAVTTNFNFLLNWPWGPPSLLSNEHHG